MTFWRAIVKLHQTGGYAYRRAWSNKRISFDDGFDHVIVEYNTGRATTDYVPYREDITANDWGIL